MLVYKRDTVLIKEAQETRMTTLAARTYYTYPGAYRTYVHTRTHTHTHTYITQTQRKGKVRNPSDQSMVTGLRKSEVGSFIFFFNPTWFL